MLTLSGIVSKDGRRGWRAHHNDFGLIAEFVHDDEQVSIQHADFVFEVADSDDHDAMIRIYSDGCVDKAMAAARVLDYCNSGEGQYLTLIVSLQCCISRLPELLTVMPSKLLRDVTELNIDATLLFRAFPEGLVGSGNLLPGVHAVHLTYCANLRDVSNVRDVSTLHIRACDIRSIQPLTGVRELILDGCLYLEDISDIAQCDPPIRDVRMFNNPKIADLSALSGCMHVHLQAMYAVDDVSPLGTCNTVLLHDMFELEDVSPLQTCHSVEIVECHKVGDASMLTTVTKLRISFHSKLILPDRVDKDKCDCCHSYGTSCALRCQEQLYDILFQ